jgi:hypothetical protein
VQRELKPLSNAGIILRIVRGRQVYYQANPQCPVFVELKALVIKIVAEDVGTGRCGDVHKIIS